MTAQQHFISTQPLLQIAAGTTFPQKTKRDRHGDITFLDELEQDQAEFVEVGSLYELYSVYICLGSAQLHWLNMRFFMPHQAG